MAVNPKSVMPTKPKKMVRQTDGAKPTGKRAAPKGGTAGVGGYGVGKVIVCDPTTYRMGG